MKLEKIQDTLKRLKELESKTHDYEIISSKLYMEDVALLLQCLEKLHKCLTNAGKCSNVRSINSCIKIALSDLEELLK